MIKTHRHSAECRGGCHDSLRTRCEEREKMSKQFVWQEVKTEYREVRASSHGEELRWLVNREKILNTATGRAVTRAVIRHLGICVMVPFLAEDQIVIMRQYRYSLDGE